MLAYRSHGNRGPSTGRWQSRKKPTEILRNNTFSPIDSIYIYLQNIIVIFKSIIIVETLKNSSLHYFCIIKKYIFKSYKYYNYINVMQSYPIIPSSTNSELGSYHWFMTLMARHKHMGEFLMDGQRPPEDILSKWGKDLFETSDELISWFHNQKVSNKVELKKQLQALIEIL